MEGKEFRKGLIKEVAKELGMKERDVAAIVDAQFRFVSDMMRRGALERIKLDYIGSFRPMTRKVRNMQVNYAKKYYRGGSEDSPPDNRPGDPEREGLQGPDS